MTILEELEKYSNDCINNKIISCQKHKWACERFLKDINKTDWEYVWNEEKAQKIVHWFTYLRHSKGVLAGQPINLTVWQKFILCQIYGWENKEGIRRFKKAFTEVARKNAKTQMQAGSLLYEISVVATKNNEIAETFCAGTKREQSKLLFNEAQNMLRGSILSSKFKITRDKIIHIKTNSFLAPLSKQDGKSGDGTNPAALVLDEYHQHPTTEFYDLSLGSNSKEPLLFIITTAGVDLNVPCYVQEYKYCSDILNPNTDANNDEYFIDICEADEEDDIENIDTWRKANPIRAYFQEGVDKLKSDFEIAKNVPEKLVAFKTKCLNMWLNKKENGYMDMAKWKACEVKEIPYDLKGRDVYIGFDMSAKIDLTSVSFIIPIMEEGTPKYILFSHSFVPNIEKLRERETVDKMPYSYWAQAGYITVTDTQIVDQQAVWEYTKAFCEEKELKINTLCFDPANASKMMMDLSVQGYNCVEVYQSYKSLNESTAGFREQVYCGNVLYLRNPVLNFAMNNAMIRTNNGLIKIDKDASIKRIDPIDATLGAYKLAQYHEFQVDLSKYSSSEYLNKLYSGGGEIDANDE
ncbi:MAG: terminase TerL endonuclease subunit [Fusobacterium sp.]|uniref:terminase large subunit n=1 Tax=Fusobacterium sp. TaxID=68766 RepID=UPI002A74D3CA|nr:terminase TerL endonuclease subunit [Fusobacterium sp.]MDY2980185.1 terminase TerL endonuclease subunit [Fusobacterium sp.]